MCRHVSEERYTTTDIPGQNNSNSYCELEVLPPYFQSRFQEARRSPFLMSVTHTDHVSYLFNFLPMTQWQRKPTIPDVRPAIRDTVNR